MAITEHQIRPAQFNEAKARTVAEDLQYLLDRRDQFVRSSCPACDAAGKPLFTKKGIEYSQCPQCRTVFVDPRPSEQLLHEFYAQSKVYEFWNKYIFPASEDARRKKIFAPRVQRMMDICRQHAVKTDVLLEVGAGFGTFCEEARAVGGFKQILAVEPTPHLAETCRQRGLTVFETPVEKLDLAEESVDVIASFETVEHLYCPRNFLVACRRYLRPGGLIVLSVPNYYGFDILALRELSNSIDHEHLNYFNPRSLPLLLERCGYRVIDTQTPGELDADIVRNKVIDGVTDLPGQDFLRHILVDRWDDVGSAFQQFLRDHMLSSHMWVTARKS